MTDLSGPTYRLELLAPRGGGSAPDPGTPPAAAPRFVTVLAGDGGAFSGAVLSLEWEEVTKGLSTLRVRLENDDHRWFSSSLLLPGNRVRFALGYAGRLTPALTYSVRAIKGFTTLEVEAADGATALAQTARSEVYRARTYPEIARVIASRAGFADLLIDDVPASFRQAEVVQSNESDAVFLARLAQGIDYVFRVDGPRFRFHRPRTGVTPSRRIAWFTGGTVKGADFDVDLLNLVPEVVARGFDPIRKETFEVKADAASADRPVLGRTTTYALLQEGFARIEVERPAGESGPVRGTSAATRAAAEGEAAGAFTAAERKQATGSLTLVGDPTRRAGEVVALAGFGRLLDGNWLVTKATHRLDAAGYQTRLEVERNALGRVSEDQPEVDLAQRNEQPAPEGDAARVLAVGILDPDGNRIVRETRAAP